ncbi:MAG: beta-propeller fold lactonase family protein [Chitinophagaceae bacterium]|nr:beta-propeller fold lactonase family protein [Chitinophagaceae bacterium]
MTNLASSDVSVINTATNTVVATVIVGTNPIGVSVSPDAGRVYVGNAFSNNVSVINAATNSVVATVAVGSVPRGISVSPDGSRVYVANNSSNSVSVINTATNTIVATVTVGAAPNGVCVSTDGNNVYVTNYNSNDVSVISTATNSVVNNIAGFNGPISVGNFISGNPVCTGTPKTFTITVNPTPDVAQPANQAVCNNSSTAAINFTGSGTVFDWTNNNTSIGLAASGIGNIASFIATNATASPVTATVTVTPSTGSNFAYITNRTSNNVSVINTATNTVVATIGVGSMPIGVSVTPDGSKVYVTNYISGNVSVISTETNTVIATVPVGTNPYGLSVSPDGSRVYVANIGTNNVSVINTATDLVISTIPAGTAPSATKLSPDGSRLYIANNGSANVSVINVSTNALVATVAIGSAPFGISVSPDGSKVYVANQNSNSISVINAVTNLEEASIPVGSGPVGTAISADGSRLYVTNQSTNQMSVINTATNSVLTTVSVGANPFGISLSADGSRIYVANYNSNDVSVISTATNTVVATVPAGANPNAFGNFITGNPVCTGTPKIFTITVNPLPVPTISGPASVCVGTTNVVYSTQAGMSGYVWTVSAGGNITAGAGTNTISVTWNTDISVTWNTVGAQSVSVNYNNANGCTAATATSHAVTVNALPVPTISGLASVCVGATNVVYSTQAGMTGYVWTVSAGGNITAGAGTNTISVTWNTVGAQSVSVNYTNANGCTAATATSQAVTVNALPVPTISGLASACVGTTNVIYSTQAGMTGYVWTVSAGGTITAGAGTNTISVTWNTVGTQSVSVNYIIANGCTAATATIQSVTVNALPVPTISGLASVCVGTTNVIYSTQAGMTGYLWTVSAGGNITAGAGTNTISVTWNTVGAQSVSVNYTNANGCTAATATSKAVTVNALPVPTISGLSSVCVGTTNVTYTTETGMSGYSWSVSSGGNITAGAGTNTISITWNTVGAQSVSVNYNNANGCTAATATSKAVTVTPAPGSVATPASQTTCSGQAITAIVLTGNVGGATYNWTRNNTATVTGIPASGSGDISGTLTNITGSPVTVTFTIAATANGCTGTPITATVLVNPSPDANATPSAQTTCSGASITTIAVTGTVSGTVFNWTRNNTGTVTGIPASGTGNISGALVNTTNAPVTVTFTITPTVGGCTPGTPVTATVLVNPPVTMNAVGNQVVCNNTPTAAVNFSTVVTGGTMTYNWSNNNTSIGLAASGTGNIPSFTAINIGNTPQVATITVTPVYNNGGVSCTGTPVSFTITVNPPPTLAQPYPTNQVICNGTPTAPVILVTPAPGVYFTWTNSQPSIGLSALGTGSIPSFTAINNGSGPVVATITITPQNGVCAGIQVSFTITVNPTPVINPIANQILCNGTGTLPVIITGPVTGAVYAWTNDNTSVGLTAAGTGNIPSFTAINNSSAPVTATVTVTSVYSSGGIACTGSPVSFTITVKPTAKVNAVGNQVVCNGANTMPVNFSGLVAGTTYNWTNSNNAIGLSSGGTGNIPAFTALNGTNAPISGTISVTPSANGCTGTSASFVITVNPTPLINQPSNQVVCNGSGTSAVNFTSPTTGGTLTFNWTNNNTSIGLAAGGTGNIPSFNAVNANAFVVTATITVTPVYLAGGINCTGSPVVFTITVNPGTPFNLNLVPPRICFTDTITTLVAWPAGGTWSGRGIIAGTNRFDPVAAGVGVTNLTYTIATGCGGAASVNVTVNNCIERHNVFTDAIRIMPNPSNGIFRIGFYSDVYKEFNMELINGDGKIIKRMHYSGLYYGINLPVNLPDLPGGHYLIRIYNDQESASFKIIIVR